jgi:hypothetical protein
MVGDMVYRFSMGVVIDAYEKEEFIHGLVNFSAQSFHFFLHWAS